MTWVVFAWNALTVLWIGALLGLAVGDSSPAECEGLDAEACSHLNDAQAGLGVLVALFVWFFVFVVLMIVWFATRPRQVVIVGVPSVVAYPQAADRDPE